MASLVADYSSSENDSENEATESENNTSHVSSEALGTQPVVCNFLINEQPDNDSSDDDKTNSEKANSADSKSEKLPNPLVNERLPVPSLALGDSKTNAEVTHSVFINPFLKAEQAKDSILEQHVKMTAQKNLRVIDGKKVCWNFRKGQCRKGSKCPFAHDNDIPLKRANEIEQPVTSHQSDSFVGYEHELDEEPSEKKKRRVGVAKGLVPPKKAMQKLNAQRAQERPWTMK